MLLPRPRPPLAHRRRPQARGRRCWAGVFRMPRPDARRSCVCFIISSTALSSFYLGPRPAALDPPGAAWRLGGWRSSATRQRDTRLMLGNLTATLQGPLLLLQQEPAAVRRQLRTRTDTERIAAAQAHLVPQTKGGTTMKTSRRPILPGCYRCSGCSRPVARSSDCCIRVSNSHVRLKTRDTRAPYPSPDPDASLNAPMDASVAIPPLPRPRLILPEVSPPPPPRPAVSTPALRPPERAVLAAAAFLAPSRAGVRGMACVEGSALMVRRGPRPNRPAGCVAPLPSPGRSRTTECCQCCWRQGRRRGRWGRRRGEGRQPGEGGRGGARRSTQREGGLGNVGVCQRTRGRTRT
jgi:hypothetical protein